ncbi:MAG TPA: glycoside hydrolase family 25 protein [Candidatus Pygmaiobacter gallistercoris]|nr:glycoside hydrolase family 25 protein [Candidatus Pygmaiobacter gallistercoris]
MAFYGIDVSYYQGTIDWQKVQVNGPDFCFVRMGYANGDGTLTIDSEFENNMNGIADTCIDTGVYLYSYLRTEQAAVEAAGEFLAIAQNYCLTMPLVFDLENTEIYGSLGKELTTGIAQTFLGRVRDAGYYPMLYSNPNFVENYLNIADLEEFDFWVADYRSFIRYTGPYGIWQYTDQGVIDGIGSRVDLDIAYRDYPAIIKSEGYNHLPSWRRILPGSRVKIRSTATVYANSSVVIPPCVRQAEYKVLKVCGRTALLSCINSWVWLEDLELIQGPTE